MMNLRYVTNMLFTPGSRPESFAKAKEVGAMGVVIDLEDAVSLADKDQARAGVIDYFQRREPCDDFLCCIRINSIKTVAGLKDVAAIVDSGIRPDCLVVPKVEYPSEAIILDSHFKAMPLPYILLIETAIGLRNAESIALSSQNVSALTFGGGDLAADLGAELSWEPMLAARSHIVRAAAQANLAVFDVPYLNIHDETDDGIIEETKKVKALGYTGKFAIHPKQIKPIEAAYLPTAAEIAQANRIVEAYKNAKGGVCEIDGKMVDVPIVHSAQRTLVLASAKKIT